MPVRPSVYIVGEQSSIVYHPEGAILSFNLLFLIVLKEKKRNMFVERNASDSTIYITPQPCWSCFPITYKAK